MMCLKKYSLQNKETGLYGFFRIFSSGRNPEFNYIYMLSLFVVSVASLLWFSIFVHVTNSFTSGSDNEVDNVLPKEEQKRVPLEGIPHLRELEHNLFLWAAQAGGAQISHRFHLNNSLQFRFF